MDTNRFDDLTRSLARSVSRRTALKAAIAALFGMAPPRQGQAAQSACPIADSCSPFEDAHCFVLEAPDGACLCVRRAGDNATHCAETPCESDADCPGANSFCASGECDDGKARCSTGCTVRGGSGRCPDGTVLCGGSCVDLGSDALHCGACGNECTEVSGPGYAAVGDCIEGECRPKCLDHADHCGDACTNFQIDADHCGACGHQCAPDELCCGGRCVAESSAERFCDACGLREGWTQYCLPFETCDRGRCVAETCPNGQAPCGDQCPDFWRSRWNCGACGAVCQEGRCGLGECIAEDGFAQAVVVVDCFAELPSRSQQPTFSDPRQYVDLYAPNWCDAAQGVLVEAVDADGNVIDACSTVGGYCVLRGPQSTLPLKIRQSILPAGIVSDIESEPPVIDSRSTASSEPVAIVNTYQQAAAATPVVAATMEPAGDLAYAVRIGDHWDIWVYSFEERRNVRLTHVHGSDQWAPAYAHDGSRLAYLSDETDGANQVWLMNPDGSDKRQISRWSGAESIVYVAWSPDDTRFIVTLSGDTRRLVTMSVDGGEFADFVPPTSSFAATGGSDVLAYTSEDETAGTILCLTSFDQPACHGYVAGDTPDLTPDGRAVVVQVGDLGNRHIETYTLRVPGPSLPAIPRLADDSNPVWLTSDHAWVAFVSAGPDGDTVEMCRLGDDHTTRMQIAPHDQVWYLSKRFT